MEYYSEIKRNELLIYVTIEMNFKCIHEGSRLGGEDVAYLKQAIIAIWEY